MWPLGFRQALQDSAVSKHVGGLESWSAQIDSPGTALAQALGTKQVRWEGAILTQPLQ